MFLSRPVFSRPSSQVNDAHNNAYLKCTTECKDTNAGRGGGRGGGWAEAFLSHDRMWD